MTSNAKITANRRNATRSTGPRTTAGKAKTRLNAYRHGLSIPVGHDDAFATELEALAEKLLKLGAKSPDKARSAATALLELRRVQAATTTTINKTRSAGEYDGLSERQRTALAVAESSPALASFERYRRRALSDLKKALRKIARPDTTDMQTHENDLTMDKFLELTWNVTNYNKQYMPIDQRSQPSTSASFSPKAMNPLIQLACMPIKLLKNPHSKRIQEMPPKLIKRIARIARKYVIADQLSYALGYIEQFAIFDDLLLHAVRVCILLIVGHPDSCKLLNNYRGQVVNGVRWEAIVLDQLHQLHKAPRMRSQLITHVEQLFAESHAPNKRRRRDETLGNCFREIRRYNAKLRDRLHLSDIVKRGLIKQKIHDIAVRFLFERQFGRALEILDRATPLLKYDWSIKALRAHALMFLGLTDEAATLYEELRSMRAIMDESYINVVMREFVVMREAGLTHPLMAEIENVEKKATV